MGALVYSGKFEQHINELYSPKNIKKTAEKFKEYEKPFLVTPHEGREKELEWSFDATQQYYKCDFWHRCLWLRARGHIFDIANRLEKMLSSKPRPRGGIILSWKRR